MAPRAGFETKDGHSDPRLRPLRVPMLPAQVFEAACEQVADLPGWELLERDETRRRLECRRARSALAPAARVTIVCEGVPDIPSTTVRLVCRADPGLLRRERARALEFLIPFRQRVG